ncbi:MAG TPA: hypothetical protein VGL99_19515 [Chloroflexota bacterium]|jgi:hypothetical protein
MTVPAPSAEQGAALEQITVSFAVADARALHAVLPWVLEALKDRPGLTAKQRRRRQMTHAALGALLSQLGKGLQAYPPPNGQENAP